MESRVERFSCLEALIDIAAQAEIRKDVLSRWIPGFRANDAEVKEKSLNLGKCRLA